MDYPQRLQENEEDRMRLLAIFPEEIWQLTLVTLDDPEDLINCTKASTFFEEVLEPRRTTYLFPQVLKVLDEQGYLNSPNFSSILPCRLVCSTWRKAVDNLLEMRPYHSQCRMPRDDFRDYKTDHSDDPAYQTHFRFFKFSIGKLQTEILPDLDNPYYRDNCPFPSRHLEIIETPSRTHYYSYEDFLKDLYGYRSGIEKLLKKVGHHFWHLSMEFQTTIKSREISRLQEYFKLMPNLRSLYIVGSYGNSMSWNQYDCGYARYGESTLRISLPNLNLLSICAGYEPILRQLLRAGENAKILEVIRRNWCDRNLWNRNPRFEGFPIEWIKSPEKLGIEIFRASEFQDLDVRMELKVLRLKMDNVEKGTLNWSDIFRKVESYQNTLEELTISLPKETEDDEKRKLWKSSKEPFQMPNLRILDLKTDNFCSLDFLLGLQNLEKLYLRWGNRENSIDLGEEDEEGDKIDFGSFSDENITECNIWNLIPSLKHLYLHSTGEISMAKKYTRDGPPTIWRNAVPPQAADDI